MNIKMRLAPLLLFLTLSSSDLHAQNTAFTYQGRLNIVGTEANGLYDFRFKLYSDSLGNNEIGGSSVANAIGVVNGLFIASVNFGPGVLTGSNLWLEVDLRTNGAASYTVLTPLQALTPAPSAVFATSAGGLSGFLPASQLTGTLRNSLLPADVVTNNSTGLTLAGNLSGNGAGVSNVNAIALNGFGAGSLWQLGGNTVGLGQFIGSTNNRPLELRVNNQPLLRLSTATNGLNGSSFNIIHGFAGNFVGSNVIGATIGGGGSSNYTAFNTNHLGYQDFDNGGTNVVLGDYGTVVGGTGNRASQTAATALGAFCTASGYISTAMGAACAASGAYSTATGQETTASGTAAFSGGADNIASGDYALAFGFANLAAGNNSAALGSLAQATNDGCFVWADGSTINPFSSTSPNQFLVQAAGGVGIGTNNPHATLDVASTWNPQLQIDQQANDYARIRFAGYTNAVWDLAVQKTMNFWCSTFGNVLTLANNGNASLAGTLSQGSDRNIKRDFAPVNPMAVLAKVAELPITEWSYAADADARHMGPVSQDFHAAFNLNGDDDKHITTVDEAGVALAAIQGLNQKLEAQRGRLDQKEAEISELKQQLAELQSIVHSLRQASPN